MLKKSIAPRNNYNIPLDSAPINTHPSFFSSKSKDLLLPPSKDDNFNDFQNNEHSIKLINNTYNTFYNGLQQARHKIFFYWTRAPKDLSDLHFFSMNNDCTAKISSTTKNRRKLLDVLRSLLWFSECIYLWITPRIPKSFDLPSAHVLSQPQLSTPSSVARSPSQKTLHVPKHAALRISRCHSKLTSQLLQNSHPIISLLNCKSAGKPAACSSRQNNRNPGSNGSSKRCAIWSRAG